MEPVLDPNRVLAALSALAGAAFWGTYQLTTLWLTGQPVARADVARAVGNVAAGIICGMLAAYFLAPAVAPLIPFTSLRDLYAVGFGFGAGSFELAPLIYRILKNRTRRLSRGGGQ